VRLAGSVTFEETRQVECAWLTRALGHEFPETTVV